MAINPSDMSPAQRARYERNLRNSLWQMQAHYDRELARWRATAASEYARLYQVHYPRHPVLAYKHSLPRWQRWRFSTTPRDHQVAIAGSWAMRHAQERARAAVLAKKPPPPPRPDPRL